MEKPMLAGCCVCLDERGWAENPLVYCDGQECSVAVHQACYGIVQVPSGPWFCQRCESKVAGQLKCQLCPHEGGAMKKTDMTCWAHVVCALYIPEVGFGNVATMEPIALQKVPDMRFAKSCYICDEMKRPKSASTGACMDCAKSGCKFSFHVTCAQMSGLLCEEAGSSNTTKYCGYCSQHFSKTKKNNPFKKLSCSKVYRLPSNPYDETCRSPKDIKPQLDPNYALTNNAEVRSPQTVALVQDSSTMANKVEQPVCEDKIDTTNKSASNTFTLSSLAEAAISAIKQEPTVFTTPDSLEQQNTGIKEKHVKESEKKIKRKPAKKRSGGELTPAKLSKEQKLKPITKVALQKAPSGRKAEKNILQDIGYAVAPKHSVINLSTFGEESLKPSQPTDIGKRKLTLPPDQATSDDGLTAIENLIQLQKSDMLEFFHEFGAPSSVAPLLKMLQNVREENLQLESNLEMLKHTRNQLLALKANLSSSFSATKHLNKTGELQYQDPKFHKPANPAPSNTPAYQFYTNNI
uniref:Protein AF-10 n=1 Tax=Ciona intestinalis TaxID=7719 RepID=F6RU53_CIOIN